MRQLHHMGEGEMDINVINGISSRVFVILSQSNAISTTN